MEEIEIIEKHETCTPLYETTDGGGVLGKELTNDNQFIYVVKSPDETLSVVSAQDIQLVPKITRSEGHKVTLTIPLVSTMQNP